MDDLLKKLNFIQWFLVLTYLSTVRELLALKKKKEQDWQDTIGAEEKAEIEEVLREADRGEVKSHEKVMDKYKK